MEVVPFFGHLLHLDLEHLSGLCEVGLLQSQHFTHLFLLMSVVIIVAGRGDHSSPRYWRRAWSSGSHDLQFTFCQFDVESIENLIRVGSEHAQSQQFLVFLYLLGHCDVKLLGEVLLVLLEGHVLQRELAEALLQILDATLGRRVLGLAVDEEEHQADDDERLDERGEEEGDAHVVAAAPALVLHLPLPLGLQVELGGRASVLALVHGQQLSKATVVVNGSPPKGGRTHSSPLERIAHLFKIFKCKCQRLKIIATQKSETISI